MRQTYRLYRQGHGLPQLASMRGLKETTVAAHLEELSDAGAEIDLRRFVSPEKQSLIEARLEQVGPFSLSLLKEGLPDDIGYTELRLMRGAWKRER
nr:helix-turn-helix domain-containing protein [Pelobacter propionicus]